MYWTMSLLPFVLLMFGFPIFLLLLVTSFVLMIFFFPVPLTAIHLTIFNSLNKYALLAVPFFIFAGDLMSRGGISTRTPALGRLDRRRRPRQRADDVARLCRAVRRGVGRDHGGDRRGRPADLSAPAAGGLQRALFLGSHHGRRRDRQPDPAVHRLHHLRHRRRHLDHRTVCGGHRTGPAAGRPVRRLHLLSRGTRGHFQRQQILVPRIPAGHARRRLGARRRRHHLRRDLFRRVLADRGRGSCLHLRHRGELFHLPRGDVEGAVRDRRALDVSHRADLHHCLGRGTLTPGC